MLFQMTKSTPFFDILADTDLDRCCSSMRLPTKSHVIVLCHDYHERCESGAAPRIFASGGKLVQGHRYPGFSFLKHLPPKFIFSSDLGHFILKIGEKSKVK